MAKKRQEQEYLLLAEFLWFPLFVCFGREFIDKSPIEDDDDDAGVVDLPHRLTGHKHLLSALLSRPVF